MAAALEMRVEAFKTRDLRVRFSLKSLLLAAVPICAVLAWAGHSLNWIRKRHTVLTSAETDYCTLDYHEGARTAPDGLWLFGEPGVIWLTVPETSVAPVERIRRLFPEAEVYKEFSMSDVAGDHRRPYPYPPLYPQYKPRPKLHQMGIDGKVVTPEELFDLIDATAP